METPLISLIIPTYNRAHLIVETLESILKQTYKNWECIIVDDGSNDNTEELLNIYCQSDARIQYYKRPINLSKGPNSCRNFGFAKSKGDWINWIDDDDLYFFNTLETWVENIRLNGKCNVFIYKVERSFESCKRINKTASKNVLKDYLIGEIVFYICGPLWNRSFLENQSSLFDPLISNLDDWDFNLRMLYTLPSIIFIDEVSVSYRDHDDSLSKKIKKLNFTEILSEIKAREKHVSILKNHEDLKNAEILKKYIAKRSVHFLYQALTKKDEHIKYYIKHAFMYNLKTKQYKTFLNIFIGCFTYKLFNKGYVFFK